MLTHTFDPDGFAVLLVQALIVSDPEELRGRSQGDMTHLNDLVEFNRIVPFVFEGKKVPMAITSALFVETLTRDQNYCITFEQERLTPNHEFASWSIDPCDPLILGLPRTRLSPLLPRLCVAIQV